MDERTALYSDVLSNPTDDTARLVLADWLEEHGEEALGRFAPSVAFTRPQTNDYSPEVKRPSSVTGLCLAGRHSAQKYAATVRR